MEEEFVDTADWEYRAEGNLHIIIANSKTRQVLRLLKCSKDRRIYDSMSTTETESELLYVRNVAHPLMRNCKACFPIQHVPLSKEFLKDIAKKIEPDRPKSRLHKTVDQTRRYGILMPDFCQVLPPPPLSSGVTISVEIKPKQGFIVKGHKRCKFSEVQYLKVQSKAYERESAYCPVDLFSGCRKRMQRAIKALILDPQNNLRVFKNANVIYSQELIRERKDKTADPEKVKEFFRSTVLSFLSGHITNGGAVTSTEKNKRASQNFQDLLCNLLLHPVCENHSTKHHIPQYCDKKRDAKSLASIKNGTDTRLASNCTLGLLLSLQKLEMCTIGEYYSMYNIVRKHLDLFPDDADVLSLEGPYDSPYWREIVDEMSESDGDKQYENEDSWTHDVALTASLLRKFLIATSFKDCSIIMTFELKRSRSLPTSSNCDLPMIIRTRHGQEYWASVALVDSDPKPACRIPEYYKNACVNSLPL